MWMVSDSGLGWRWHIHHSLGTKSGQEEGSICLLDLFVELWSQLENGHYSFHPAHFLVISLTVFVIDIDNINLRNIKLVR